MFAPVRRADRILTLMLVLSDLVTIPVVFIFIFVIRTRLIGDMLPEFRHNMQVYIEVLPVVAVLWLVCFAYARLYAPERGTAGMGYVQKLVKALIWLAISLMAMSYLVKMDYSRVMLFMFVVCSLPATMIMRALARRMADLLAPSRRRRGSWWWARVRSRSGSSRYCRSSSRPRRRSPES